MADSSWIDHVPGARAAYDYLGANVARFLAIGPALQRQVAKLDEIWNNLPAPPPGGRTAAQLAALNEWVAARNQLLGEYDRWALLEPSVRWVWTAAQNLTNSGQVPSSVPGALPGLGWVFTPAALALVIKVAGYVIAAVAALKIFLDSRTISERTVAGVIERNVAAGNITPQEGVDTLRAGMSGGDDFTTILKYGGLALLGIMALQLIVPPRGRRR